MYAAGVHVPSMPPRSPLYEWRTRLQSQPQPWLRLPVLTLTHKHRRRQQHFGCRAERTHARKNIACGVARLSVPDT